MDSRWMIALTPMLATASEIVCEVDRPQAEYVVIEDQAKIPLLNPSMQKISTAKIRLKNGVEAYIVSDPDAKHSASAVIVKVGQWQDPKEYQGMAHFVEHVLFMGTKAYPDENDYFRYIGECAGTCNAFTASDRTAYLFSVNHDGFVGAFDRLSHFFIDPLLCTSSLDRELHSVDQEYIKNLEHDRWRVQMLMKEVGNHDHPNILFSTGNAEILSSIPQETLRAWYGRYYVPHNMHVIVISPLPKEELIEIVTSRFSLIKPATQQYAEQTRPRLFSKDQQGSLVSVKPLRDLKELSLNWQLPASFNGIDSDSAEKFLSYLLNSPHEGGLIDTLKQEQLILDASSTMDRYGDTEVFFTTTFSLTEEGVKQRDRITEKAFQTLAKIREKAPLERFEEMRNLSMVHYQYQTRQNAFDLLMELAMVIPDEDLSTFPEKTMVVRDFSPDLFSDLLEYLTPENCSFVLLADPKLSGVTPNRKERWMGAEYALVPIENSKLTAWANVSLNGAATLPSANPFIPEHLALLPKESVISDSPSLAVSDEQSKVYFQRDTLYQVPEIGLVYRINTPVIDGSAKAAALSELFCLAFDQKLHSTLNMARIAGLSASLAPGHHFLQLSLTGYSEKAPRLASFLFAKLKGFQISEERYGVLKKNLVSLYGNASKELPYAQGKELLDNLLISDSPTQLQKQKALENLDYAAFQAYCKEVFNQVYIQGLSYGNCLKEETISLSSQLAAALDADTLPEQKLGQRKVRLLPQEDGPFVVVESTETLGKAALLSVQQGSFSYSARAEQLVLGRFLRDFFHDRLRTKQQTGYIVLARDVDVEGQLMQLFLVQSSSHQPAELLARYDLFLDELNQEFDTLISKESFTKMRAMLAQELRLPPENLQGMTSRLSTLAFDYEADFAYYPKLIDSLQKLTLDDVKQFSQRTLSRDNTRRLAVLVEGKMPGKRPFVYRKSAKEEITSMGELEARNLR